MTERPDLPTKAVVLARGLGTRMRAARDAVRLDPDQAAMADTGMKAMIPVTPGRPFLDYILASIADAGFSEVCLVVAPDHEALRAHVEREVPLERLRVSFAVQAEPRGTADAVLSASEFIGGDSFVVMNGDNYYPDDVLAELRRQPAPALPAFSRVGLIRDGQIPSERIAQYALLEIDDEGILRRIVEKPNAEQARALGDTRVSMNCWLLTPAIFEACQRVLPSVRGEVELPLAVQLAIEEMGMRFTAFRTDAPVLDLSHRADIPRVARRLEMVEVRW